MKIHLELKFHKWKTKKLRYPSSFSSSPLEKSMTTPLGKKKIHDNQRDNKNTNTSKDQSIIHMKALSHEWWTQLATNKPKQQNLRTQATNPWTRWWTHDLSGETHDLGGETHEPKLGLNPRLKWRLFSPLFLSFLFVQSKNSSSTGNHFLRTQVPLEINSFTLKLLQWTRVYYPWDVSFINSLETMLTNKIVWKLGLFWKKNPKVEQILNGYPLTGSQSQYIMI